MRHSTKTLYISLLSLTPLTSAFAGGFTLYNQSIAATGLAGAGAAVLTGDASTQYTNPAAMNQLPTGNSLSVNGSLTKTSTNINDGYASVLDATTATSKSFAGSNNGDMTPIALRPSVFYTFPIQEYLGYKDLSGGLALYSPFAFNNNYEPLFAGRLFADKTKFNVNTLAASLSFPLFDNKDLTFGAGYLMSRATGTVSRVLDANGAFMVVKATDKLSNDYNLGLFYKVTPKLNVAATFVSPKQFHLAGSVNVTTSPTAAQAAKAATSTAAAVSAVDAFGSVKLNGTASYDMITPGSYELAASYQVNPTVIAYGSTTRTRWSSVNNLAISTGLSASNIKSQLTAQLPSTFTDAQLTADATALATKYGSIKPVALNFNDINNYAFGASWQKSPQWLLRAGFALDASPTNYGSRTVLLPIGSSRTLAGGANYVISPTMNVDLAYSLKFNNAVAVSQKDSASDTYFANFKGTEQSVAAQLNMRF